MKVFLQKNWYQFKTFPCKENTKIPATAHGYKDAQFGQNVEAMIEQGYNVGLDCAGSGLIVIDLDFHNEKADSISELKELESKLGNLPKTLTQKTASGKGRHLIFSAKGITNPKGKLSPNSDIKYNGYIIIAPSRVNGSQYEIIDGVDENGDFIIAELPELWLNYINKSNVESNISKSANTKSEQNLCNNINIQKMFDNCKFLADCKENADCISYQQWHSMITILAQIEDSDELIHSLSEPYPSYSFEETQKKIDLARQFGKPHTCKYISEEFPEICKKCISSTNKEEREIIMADADKQDIQDRKTPLSHGKETIFDIFSKNKNILNTTNFISKVTLGYKACEYNLPNQNKFFHQEWNKTFLVEKQKKKLKIKLIANFVVEDVKECIFLYNDKSGKTPLKYYLASLKNANGKIEKDIEIANNSKSDYKQFQTHLNQFYNGFAVNMAESEFKAFVEKYISPNVASKLNLYKNAGVISDNKFIYQNALVESDKILWADDNGYIKTGDANYIKIADATHNLPKLHKSNKTGKQVANELITNILECWQDNVVLPLLTLGHMIMSIHFENFVKNYGVPTLLLFGESGTGKSTLITVGLCIFGLSKEAMTSGGSTAKSNEYFAANYNGINVCTDDVKGETLNSGHFIALIKGAYKAIARTKMLPYGRGVEYINICSPLAYSTNEPLPDLREIINRINVIEIFGKDFKADKFKYHELNYDNLKELSLILPEIIKIPKNDIFKLYEDLFALLKNNVPDTQKRVISNIAYAYTGTLLLLNTAQINIPDLEQKIIQYAISQITKYENIQTPIDRVLSEIANLSHLNVLKAGTHYKVGDKEYAGKMETHIRFHKDLILSAINKYYSHDKSKQINEQAFLSYARNHERFRGNGKSVRYKANNNKVSNSLCFNISGLYEYTGIVPGGVLPMTYDELKDGLENQNS